LPPWYRYSAAAGAVDFSGTRFIQQPEYPLASPEYGLFLDLKAGLLYTLDRGTVLPESFIRVHFLQNDMNGSY